MKSWCPRCGADAAPGAKMCAGCGAAFAASSTESGGDRKCPRCRSALREVREGSLSLDRCGACRGAWYDRGELEEALAPHEPAGPLDPIKVRRDLAEIRQQPVADRGYLPCAACGQLMNRKNFGSVSGVLVDVCRDHGLWLDGGELEKLIAFVEKGGLTPENPPIPRETLDAMQDSFPRTPAGPKWRTSEGNVPVPWPMRGGSWLAVEIRRLFN